MGEIEEEKYVAPLSKAIWFVLTIGVLMFVICALAAIGKVGIASLRGPMIVGCKGWIILDS